jgi:tyrosyl-tRNA synthetase
MDAIKDRIADVLTRGVGDFIDPDNRFEKVLTEKASGTLSRDVVVKFGVDPTKPDIHLGHAVVLRKLRQLQDLGCKVVFLIGDYTAQIGDPTGKNQTRPILDQGEVEKNMKTYLDQVGKILRTDKEVFSWIRNTDWFFSVSDTPVGPDTTVSMNVGEQKISIPANSLLGKAFVYEVTRMQRTSLGKEGIISITLRTLLWTLQHITHARLIERDMFQERLKKGEELYMHEMLYPVLQGIDSYALSLLYGSCDLEIGGTDQTFNMLMGRDVMKINNGNPQSVLALELLVGTDGKEKMSKSVGNYIGITEKPEDIFGKVMSVPDSAISTYFLLATYSPKKEVGDLEKKIANGDENPRDIKLRLAKEITAIYHGEEAAEKAKEFFLATFSRKETPTDVLTVVAQAEESLADVLVRSGLVSSKTEVKRLERDGALRFIEGEGFGVLESFAEKKGEWVLRVGSYRFIKIVSK